MHKVYISEFIKQVQSKGNHKVQCSKFKVQSKSNMRELIKEIWSTSKRNKLRTSLTGFAVAWGIFMLIFLLGAGNGLINAQLQQSTRFLANSMRVFPGETSKAYKGLKEGRSITRNDKDILISNKTYGQYVDDVGGRLEQYNVNIN